jgi:DNA/RNA-binding domain of Phe-tRNA-synthetase-like protein
MIIQHREWAQLYPGASVGILIMKDVENITAHEKLNLAKRELEAALRDKYMNLSRNAMKASYPIDQYAAYYKKFGNSYHVLLQLESVVKGKSIPTVSALVEAMFMAELKNMLLTAGHDLEQVNLPLECKLATGNEKYTGINGKEVSTVQHDMIIADAGGVISSIIKGPDLRTRLSLNTSQALFAVYAPPGIKEDLVYKHLDNLENYVRIFASQSITAIKQVAAPKNFHLWQS